MAITSVKEKVAIVTGAASGMGAALATKLVALGWRVACVDVQEGPGVAFAASLGPNAHFFQADVASYASQAAMFTAVWEKWGRIDALCANAGIADRSSLYILGWRGKEGIPPEPDLSCTDVDYKGVVYGTQLAIHFMRKNAVPGGKIVCTASVAGLFPFEIIPEYCGAKAAVINFVRAMAPVLKVKENVTINAVCPGIVETPIIPPEMIAAVSRECLTLPSTIVRGYLKFLEDNDDSLTGQILEGSVDKLLFYDTPKEANGKFTIRAVTVWDPHFKMLHGELSGIPDALA